MKLKYIIFETAREEFIPIVFPVLPFHSDIAKAFKGTSEITGKPINAGFCEMVTENDTVEWICYGESLSLQLKSNGDRDAKIIREYYR